LETIGIGALAFLLGITCAALYGPQRLPAWIPTHFDLAGHPNGWGSSSVLPLFPVVALVLYLGMTIVGRIPSAFNYPVRVTAENRPRLEALTLQMIAWLKTEIVCLFAWIQWTIVDSARQGRLNMSPLQMPLFVLAILATIVGHIAAMFRAASRG
jgi:uncharacterized membrane protein